MILRWGHRARPLATLAALLAFSIFASAGLADDYYDLQLQPTLSQADFDGVLPRLALGPDQEHRIAAAHAVYLAGMMEAIGKSRAAIARIDVGEPVGNEDLSYAFLESRTRLDSQLESEVIAVLADEARASQWRSAFAAGRRRTMLRELSRDQFLRRTYDPLEMLAPIPLADAERAAVAPVVADFEARMDQALQAIAAERAPMFRVIEDGRNEHPKMSEAESKALQTRYKETCDRWQAMTAGLTAMVAAAMPRLAAALDEHRQAFQDAWDRADYPEAFVPCPVELAVNALRMAEDVAPDKQAAIEEAFAQYQPARDELTRRIVSAVRTWETGDSELKRQVIALNETRNANKEPNFDLDAHYARLRELTSKHPAVALVQRRHDLAMDALKQLRSLFSNEEFNRLPLASRLCLGIREGK